VELVTLSVLMLELSMPAPTWALLPEFEIAGSCDVATALDPHIAGRVSTGVAVAEALAGGRRPGLSPTGETAYEGTGGGDSQMSAEAVSPLPTYFRRCGGG